jgi:hypothetical protein
VTATPLSATMLAVLAAMVEDETAGPEVQRVWRDPGTLYKRGQGWRTLNGLYQRGLVEPVPDRPDYMRVTEAGRAQVTQADVDRARIARAGL